MGIRLKRVKVMGVCGENPEKEQFQTFYNEEVNFLENQGGVFCSIYPWPGGNPVGIEIMEGEIVIGNSVTTQLLRRKEMVKKRDTSTSRIRRAYRSNN